jgi:3-oxoacyl-[acyl-carrier-protein] synthase II
LNRRVVITGVGAVTPLGLTADEYWQGLISGRSGIGLITLFDSTLFPVKVAAEVKGFDPARYMSVKRADRTSRCTHFAIAAARMALESAGMDMSREDRERVGVTIATSGMTSILPDYAEVLRTRPMRIDPLLANKIASSMVPAQIGLEFGAKGPNVSLNSACSSGNDALGTAMSRIWLGDADVMIAGGAEAAVSAVSFACMSVVGALSRTKDPQKACRPFDLNRNGMVFGEGAGILILETLEHARGRKAPILAEMAGAGWSFDAFNDTAPDAAQQAVAMRNAIKKAGLLPQDIDYINAHGTSTKLNDATETQAVKMVFGEKAYKIPMSSNKSMIGHLACAAGALQGVTDVLMIQNGIIPPTINLETADPDCDLDYVPGQARYQEVTACLSNSFGMGGQNCCVVIKRLSDAA